MSEFLTPYLESDEELLWIDSPNPQSLAKQYLEESFHGFIGMLFGIVWTSVSISQSSNIDELATYAFVTLGIGLILWSLSRALKPIYKYLMARYVTYGITSKRLIIATSFPKKRVRSFYAQNFGLIEVEEEQAGLGTITFGKEEWKGNTRKPQYRKIGFFGVRDFRQVGNNIARLKAHHDAS